MLSFASKIKISTIVSAALLFSASSFAAPMIYPKVVQNLMSQGFEIKDAFQASTGNMAYAASYNGQPMMLYLTQDKKHVVVGTLVDESGNNLTQVELQKRVIEPEAQAAWDILNKAKTVHDGKADAPVIVYAFMDPNCPYCHKFREAAEPWIAAGRVQVRHITVGILGENSEGKAATILGSKDQTAAVLENQHIFRSPGIRIDPQLVKLGTAQMHENNELMRKLGITGTPAVYYKDAQGKIQVARGMPSPEAMEVVMGSKKP